MPLTTGVNRLGGSDFNGYTNRSIGVRSEKTTKKGEETERKGEKKPRSGKNLNGIYEISPNPMVISPNLMRFR